jgi:hypothetical protein
LEHDVSVQVSPLFKVAIEHPADMGALKGETLSLAAAGKKHFEHCVNKPCQIGRSATEGCKATAVSFKQIVQ